MIESQGIKNRLATITPYVLPVLLLAGAVVRVLYFLQLKDTNLATVPLLDCQTYHDWAVSLAGGDQGWNQAFWMGPLYPHLLAVTYYLFGVESPSPFAIQLALSLFNVWLVYRLALAMTDKTGVALLAAALYSFYGAPVFYAGILLMATLVTTMYLLVAWQTVRTVAKPSLYRCISLGLLVGLTGLARGNVLLLLATLPLLLWYLAKTIQGNQASGWKSHAALIIAGLLVLVPVTVRNYVVADDFVLLTSNGGVNLLIGQQTEYKGMFAPVMDQSPAEYDFSMETSLEKELGRDLKGSEVSRILTRRAWNTFQENLSAMPLHYLRKIYRFWNGYELPQIVSFDYWRTQFSALKPLLFPYTLLSALGLLGLRWLPPRQRWIMIVLLGTYFLSLLPFFPTSRYRQPIAPLLAISTAVFILAMLKAPQRQRLSWLAGAAVLTVALLPRWASLDNSMVHWQVHLHEASRASKIGDRPNTLKHGRLAEEVRPGLPDTPFQLAQFLEDMGAHQEALAALQLAQTRLSEDPNRLIPFMLGRNHEKAQQYTQAEAAYKKAIELDEGWAQPWLRLGLVYKALGQSDQALQSLIRAYSLEPGNQHVRGNLASAYAEAGQLEKSREILQGLVADYPLYLNGWFNLALVHLRSGQADAAQQALDQATSIPHLDAAQLEQLSQLRKLIQRVQTPSNGPS